MRALTPLAMDQPSLSVRDDKIYQCFADISVFIGTGGGDTATVVASKSASSEAGRALM